MQAVHLQITRTDITGPGPGPQPSVTFRTGAETQLYSHEVQPLQTYQGAAGGDGPLHSEL